MNAKYTTSRAICCGLQVPWLRAAVVSALAAHFDAAGRNQSALARTIGVSPASVRRWLHDDPELRAALYAPQAPWHCGACGHETRGEPDSCPMCRGGGH